MDPLSFVYSILGCNGVNEESLSKIQTPYLPPGSVPEVRRTKLLYLDPQVLWFFDLKILLWWSFFSGRLPLVLKTSRHLPGRAQKSTSDNSRKHIPSGEVLLDFVVSFVKDLQCIPNLIKHKGFWSHPLRGQRSCNPSLNRVMTPFQSGTDLWWDRGGFFPIFLLIYFRVDEGLLDWQVFILSWYKYPCVLTSVWTCRVTSVNIVST